MGFAHFIARRILADRDRQDRLSRPIVVIAVLGIVIGMAVMILTVGITTGFQREIRTKVADAGASLQVTAISQTDPKETPRVAIDPGLMARIAALPGVRHVQVFATKPGIIETAEEIQGVVVKGVGPDFDRQAMGRHLVEGELPLLSDTARSPDALLSRFLARRLAIAVGDTITIYLVKGREDIRPRKFRVSGIYETGIEQIDHQLVLIDIGHLQRFSGWGLQAEILVHDSCGPGGLLIEGLAFGGDRAYTFDWPGTGLRGRGPHWICSNSDTTLQLIVRDGSHTLPDTAWLTARVPHGAKVPCACGPEVKIDRRDSGGSHRRYAGGYEVAIADMSDLARMDDEVYRLLDVGLKSVSVIDRYPELFSWLDLLDANVVVVIVLMVVVAIINMTSALLIIILERTAMIGVLKALGAGNGLVRRIFLIDAAYLLGAGILFGDLLGIGLGLLQQRLGIVRLPIESYYVDAVPVALDAGPILLLNAGTLAVCVAALMVPSLLVAGIAPVKAIRFE